ncbi:MAG TPA: alternative ribosome rescue aminoacyl-tRNA hydrolase ArfB [Caulobacteraceae bacterium]
MIEITDQIALHDDELVFHYILASGPGGQNVNKVNSAAQLRFDARRSPSLPTDVSVRLQRLAGARLTNDGVIVITAKRFRSQERNRADALGRLTVLIVKAAKIPARRVPTGPTRAEKERRLRSKARRGEIKSLRAKPEPRD